MSALDDVLKAFNSGERVAPTSKHRPYKPKPKPGQASKFRGAANAVNNSARGNSASPGTAGAGGGAVQNRATPPPAGTSAAPTTAGGLTLGGGPAAPAGGLGLGLAGAAATAAPAAAAVASVLRVSSDAPLALRQKRVVDELKKTRDVYSFSRLRSAVGIDLSQVCKTREGVHASVRRCWLPSLACAWSNGYSCSSTALATADRSPFLFRRTRSS
jgi:hypothetical protein